MYITFMCTKIGLKKKSNRFSKNFLICIITSHSKWSTFKKELWNIESSRTLEFIQLSLSPSAELSFIYFSQSLTYFLLKYLNQWQNYSFTQQSSLCVDTFWFSKRIFLFHNEVPIISFFYFSFSSPALTFLHFSFLPFLFHFFPPCFIHPSLHFSILPSSFFYSFFCLSSIYIL